MASNIDIEKRIQAIEIVVLLLAELQGLPVSNESVEEDIIELASMYSYEVMSKHKRTSPDG